MRSKGSTLLVTPSAREGKRLLAHELTHVVQQEGNDLIQRQPPEPSTTTSATTPTQGSAPAPVPSPTATSNVESLRQLLESDQEEEAIQLMGQLNSEEVAYVLARDDLKKLAVSAFDNEEMYLAVKAMRGDLYQSLKWMFEEGTDWEKVQDVIANMPYGNSRVIQDKWLREQFVSICDNEEMAAAVDILGGTLLQKLTWMKTEGSSWSLVKEKLKVASTQEKVALYDNTEIRDFFVEICTDATMTAAVRELEGTLIQKLTWMKAEGSDWFLVWMTVSETRNKAERSELYNHTEMREFFLDICTNLQMREAVNLLGGTLSQQMEWLGAEGSDYSPEQAEMAPTISPRDEELLNRLESKHHLYQLAKEYIATVKARDRELISGAAFSWVLFQKYEQRIAELEPQLNRELKAGDFSDLKAFLEEIKKFEAFFLGYALQTAFQMLKENEKLAGEEMERYVGGDLNELYEALKPARDKIAEARAETQKLAAPPVSPKHIESRAEVHRLANKIKELESEARLVVQSLTPTYPILADPQLTEGYRIYRFVDTDREELQTLFKGTALDRLEDIKETREGLREDTSRVWQMEPVLARSRQDLHIAEGSVYDAIIQDKLEDIKSEETFKNIALGALALVLGLASGGAGTVAVLAAVGSAGLSTYMALESLEKYQFESAAAGTAFDRAKAVSSTEPSLFWLALDLVAVIPDLGAALKAFRGLASPAKAAVSAEDVADVMSEAEKIGKEVGVENLADVAGKSVERQIKRTHRLTEEAEAVSKMPQALDEVAKVGLLDIGDVARKPLLNAFKDQPAILKRLGYLVDQDKSIAKALDILNNNLKENDWVLIIGDLMQRRDFARSEAVLRAIKEGAISGDELMELGKSLQKIDSIGGKIRVFNVLARSEDEFLAFTRSKRATELTIEEAQRELNIARRRGAGRSLFNEPDYDLEIVFNGHTWRRNKHSGAWCRHSNGELCFIFGEGVAVSIEESLLTKVIRRQSGFVSGGARLPEIRGRWFDLTKARVAPFPRQIAERMRRIGHFNNWDDFRSTFWKLVAEDPVLGIHWDPVRGYGWSEANLARMQQGLAPFVESSQAIGGGSNAVFQLNHIYPLEYGGSLYDFDNIEVVSPLFHVEIAKIP